uniref:Uncharacterized protein n=1 Tax=Sphaerodactylus townsendi TaxID=933632 RepID=A0ACB8FP03_9SAUR
MLKCRKGQPSCSSADCIDRSSGGELPPSSSRVTFTMAGWDLGPDPRELISRDPCLAGKCKFRRKVFPNVCFLRSFKRRIQALNRVLNAVCVMNYSPSPKD